MLHSWVISMTSCGSPWNVIFLKKYLLLHIIWWDEMIYTAFSGLCRYHFHNQLAQLYVISFVCTPPPPENSVLRGDVKKIKLTFTRSLRVNFWKISKIHVSRYVSWPWWMWVNKISRAERTITLTWHHNVDTPISVTSQWKSNQSRSINSLVYFVTVSQAL